MKTQTVLDSRTKFPTLSQIKEIVVFLQLKEGQKHPTTTHVLTFKKMHSRL
jgi:hypothetical protein